MSRRAIDYVSSIYFKRTTKSSNVGCASNLYSRVKRHKSGDGAEFTKRNRTFNIVYTETFSTLLEARRRESQIKGWRREKKENLIKFGKPIV